MAEAGFSATREVASVSDAFSRTRSHSQLNLFGFTAYNLLTQPFDAMNPSVLWLLGFNILENPLLVLEFDGVLDLFVDHM